MRRSRRLVISSIFTVGNYDYGIFWYLYLDGTIQMEIKLTGIVTTRASPTATILTYAAQVAPEVAAPDPSAPLLRSIRHGDRRSDNTAYRVDVEVDEPGPTNPHHNAFRAVPPTRNRAAGHRRVDAAKARTWRSHERGADQPTRPADGLQAASSRVTPRSFPGDICRMRAGPVSPRRTSGSRLPTGRSAFPPVTM